MDRPRDAPAPMGSARGREGAAPGRPQVRAGSGAGAAATVEGRGAASSGRSIGWERHLRVAGRLELALPRGNIDFGGRRMVRPHLGAEGLAHGESL